VKLKALKQFVYKGRQVHAGDVIEVTERDYDVLIRDGYAEKHEDDDTGDPSDK
jgi:hypothetical protein